MTDQVKLSMAIAAMRAWDEQLSQEDGSFGTAEVREAIRATLAAIDPVEGIFRRLDDMGVTPEQAADGVLRVQT
jgi:hypothetical protein